VIIKNAFLMIFFKGKHPTANAKKQLLSREISPSMAAFSNVSRLGRYYFNTQKFSVLIVDILLIYQNHHQT